MQMQMAELVLPFASLPFASNVSEKAAAEKAAKANPCHLSSSFYL
jgi:hypothetical protein